MPLPLLLFTDLAALLAALVLTWALPELRLGFVGAYGVMVVGLMWAGGDVPL